MPVDAAQRHQWLARTFAPYILVGGSETAKREVAFLTGLSLACLFQPFNGEVVHRVRARIKSVSTHAPGLSTSDISSASDASDDDDSFSPEQLDQTSTDSRANSKVPPLPLHLRVESALCSGSGSTKSNSGGGGPVKRRSRPFCVRFMNMEEAEAISCLSLESLATRSLLLASPSVSELREHMRSRPLSDIGCVGIGCPSPSSGGMSSDTELPWFNEWRRVIFEGSRFSPHETLSQPVGLILIVSTRDPDPVAALEELLRPTNMPQLCRQYILDPNPVRAVILLDVHADAYASRMHASHGGPQWQDAQPFGGDPSPATEGAADHSGASGEALHAAGGRNSDKALTRSKEIMERLCSVFPPANCHLLTLGRGCTDTRHIQVGKQH